MVASHRRMLLTGHFAIQILSIQRIMNFFRVDIEVIDRLRIVLSCFVGRHIGCIVRCFETVGLIVGLSEFECRHKTDYFHRRRFTHDAWQIDVVEFLHHDAI